MRTFFHFCIKIGAKEYTVPAVFSLAKLHDVTCIVNSPHSSAAFLRAGSHVFAV